MQSRSKFYTSVKHKDLGSTTFINVDRNERTVKLMKRENLKVTTVIILGSYIKAFGYSNAHRFKPQWIKWGTLCCVVIVYIQVIYRNIVNTYSAHFLIC